MFDQQSDGKINTSNATDSTCDSGIQWVNRLIGKEMDLEQLNCYLEEILNPVQLKVIRLRFGLQEDHCYTVDEVCKELNETYDHISYIESKALRQIRDPDGRRAKARWRKLRDYYIYLSE